MSPPPTLFSRASRILRVAIPLTIAVLLFVFRLPAQLGVPDTAGFLFASGLLAYYVALRSLAYSVRTVGVRHRVDTESFSDPERRCVACDARLFRGERRRYAKQFVVLGVPVRTLDWGANDYCRSCLDPAEGPIRSERAGAKESAIAGASATADAPETDFGEKSGRERSRNR